MFSPFLSQKKKKAKQTIVSCKIESTSIYLSPLLLSYPTALYKETRIYATVPDRKLAAFWMQSAAGMRLNRPLPTRNRRKPPVSGTTDALFAPLSR